MMHKFWFEEKGEVNVVAIVLLIGIAVILALIFKNSIMDLMKDLFAGISGRADKINQMDESESFYDGGSSGSSNNGVSTDGGGGGE